MHNYKKYKIWKIAHNITLDVYKISESFPNREIYGLTNQIRRASMSIVLNIVEGSARETDKEFIRFLYISAGSAAEIEYLIQLATELHYINMKTSESTMAKILLLRKSIYKLIQTIKKANSQMPIANN